MDSSKLLQDAHSCLSMLTEDELVCHLMNVIQNPISSSTVRQGYAEALVARLQATEENEKLSSGAICLIQNKGIETIKSCGESNEELRLRKVLFNLVAKSFSQDAENVKEAMARVVCDLWNDGQNLEALMMLEQCANIQETWKNQIFCDYITDGFGLGTHPFKIQAALTFVAFMASSNLQNELLRKNTATFMSTLGYLVSSPNSSNMVEQVTELLIKAAKIICFDGPGFMQAYLQLCFEAMRSTELDVFQKGRLLNSTLSFVKQYSFLARYLMSNHIPTAMDTAFNMAKARLQASKGRLTESWSAIHSCKAITRIMETIALVVDDNQILQVLLPRLENDANTNDQLSQCAIIGIISCLEKAYKGRSVRFLSAMTNVLYQKFDIEDRVAVKMMILILLPSLNLQQITTPINLNSILWPLLFSGEIEEKKAAAVSLLFFCKSGPLDQLARSDGESNCLLTCLRKLLNSVKRQLDIADYRFICQQSLESISALAERWPDGFIDEHDDMLNTLMSICFESECKDQDEENVICRSEALRSVSKVCAAVATIERVGKEDDAKRILRYANYYKIHLQQNKYAKFANSSEIAESLFETYKNISQVMGKKDLGKQPIQMLLKFVEQDDSSRKIAALDAISSMALTSDCLSKVQTNKVLAVIPLLLECTTSHAAFLRITPQSPLVLLYKCQQKIVNGRTVESIWQMVVEKFKTCEIEDRQIFIESILRGLKLAPAVNVFNKVAIQNLTALAEHVIFDYLSRVDAFKQEVKMPGLNSQFIPPSKEKIDSDIATLLEVGGWLSLLKSATGLLSHVMSIYVTLEPHLSCNTDTLRSRCSALANNLLADNENGDVPYFQRLCGIDIWNSLFRFPDLQGS